MLIEGYGLADPTTGVPCSSETLFDIASAAKQVTAAAILTLVESGELALDDPIAKYLPGVPSHADKMTIDHLLTHTTGMPRSAGGGHGDDLEAAVRAYFSERPTRPPGEQFEYWNGGYALLAGIVEQVSGQVFEDYVQEQLFQPAGLLHTDFIETARVDPARLARTREPGHKLTTDYIKGWGYRGMGGVLTSAHDLGLWAEEVFRGKSVISNQVRKQLFEPALQGYARGWRVGQSPTGQQCMQHGGSSPGFQTELRYFPDEDLILIVLTNVEGVAYPVAGLLEAALHENQAFTAPPELIAWKERDRERWVGEWVTVEGDRLVLQPTKHGLAVRRASPKIQAVMQQAAGGIAAEWEIEKAREVVLALAQGDAEPLEEVLMEGIPIHWPQQVARDILPGHYPERGKIQGVELLGSSRLSGGRVIVWLDVEHEKGRWPVEIRFTGKKLHFLDWETQSMPKSMLFAPTEKNLCQHFAFRYERSPSELELIPGKGKKPSTLVVRGGRTELELTRP